MVAWRTATPITGCVVTSGTRAPRKYTVRPSRRLAMYSSADLRGMSSYSGPSASSGVFHHEGTKTYDTTLMHVKELFDLTGKVALITGGSRGLGLSMAHALGEAGAAVAITARRDQWLRAAEDELRAARIECLAATCDVADQASVDRVVSDVLRRFKHIDVLVNNAGTSWGAPAADMPLDKWRQVLDT